jgi:hypothetical protein
VKLVEQEFVEEDRRQHQQEGIGLGAFFKDKLPRCLVFFAGVLSREVEEQIVGDLGEEVGPVTEAFDLKELPLHQGMDGLDVGLEAVLAGGMVRCVRPGKASMAWVKAESSFACQEPMNSEPLSDCHVTETPRTPQTSRCRTIRSAKDLA